MAVHWVAILVLLSCLVGGSKASAGDADPVYRTCLEQCNNTGCVGKICFPHCKSSLKDVSTEGPWYMQEPLYLRWKQWGCQIDCRYYCMVDREAEKAALGYGPVKYHGKWPFRRIYGFQEPASVALSVLNLAMHFQGWLSFSILLYYKLPLEQGKKTYYEYTGLWHIYALLSMNSWFWSAIFHSRDVDITEKLDYSSAVALLGYSLILAILRALSMRTEAARVMAAAPLLAFVTTHILYLNNYKMDYGWNMKVCVVMAVAQLLIWAIWAGVSKHPSRWKLWLVVFGGGLAMLLEIYDFPPYEGIVDAHALWHATTIPLTYLWWSFIRDDAKFEPPAFLRRLSSLGETIEVETRSRAFGGTSLSCLDYRIYLISNILSFLLLVSIYMVRKCLTRGYDFCPHTHLGLGNLGIIGCRTHSSSVVLEFLNV